MIVLAVFVGGALGAVLRDRLDLVVARPWATALVNVVGSVVLGAVVGLDAEFTRTAVGVGFCGALTTFSSHSLHVVRLVRERRTGTALALTALTTAGALLGVSL